MVEEFSFLKELVAPIAEVQSNNNEYNTNKHTTKQKHESKQLRQDSSTLHSEDPSTFKVPTRGRLKFQNIISQNYSENVGVLVYVGKMNVTIVSFVVIVFCSLSVFKSIRTHL